MFYKVLRLDGTPYHGGQGRWPLPNGQPAAWVEVSGDLVPCRHGLHLCAREHLVRWLGPAIFEAEYDGRMIDHGDKLVVARARLLRRLESWTPRTQRLFAADCAVRALTRERERGREPDARSWAAIDVARRFARDEATEQERAAAADAADAAAAAPADAAAADAADAERQWQTDQLFRYLDGKLA